MASVVMAADPGLREMVRLSRPGRCALALMVTMMAISAAVLVQFIGPAIALVQELRDQPGPLGALWLARGWWMAAALLLIALGASLAIAPRREALLRAEWGRRRVALQVGLLLWAITVLVIPPAFGWRAPDQFPDPFVLIITTAWQLLCAMAPLGGLRSLFSILGQRSRKWREGRQGRQGVDALVGAAGGVLVFSTAVPMMASLRIEMLHTLAVFLTVASAAVLGLGLLYLVMNAWWIARSLMSPAVTIESMVEGEAPRSTVHDPRP